MADPENPKPTNEKPAEESAANLNHCQEPTEGSPKPEEIEMEISPADNTVLDFEATNVLLPGPPEDKNLEDTPPPSKTTKRRKSTPKPGDPLVDPVDDCFYDDEDWMSDEEDEDGEDEEEGEENERRKKRSWNILALFVQAVQTIVKVPIKQVNRLARGHLLLLIFLGAYGVYLARAFTYRFGDEGSHRLIGCTILGGIIIVWPFIAKLFKMMFIKLNGSAELSPRARFFCGKCRFVLRWLLYFALAGFIAFTILDQSRKSMSNLRSLPGLAVFLFVCLLFSRSPGNINWHTIYWSIGLQFVCAMFVLKWDTGKDMVLWVQYRFDEFMANSEAGSKFIFGDSYKDHFMIFGAFPLFLYINATLAVLYYVGAIQFVIRVIGSFLSFVTDASPLESISVASSIFLEGAVAVLSIKPYLGSLSRSQLFVVMTSMYSSLGGAYISFLSTLGVPFSQSVPAMLISAPATLAVCKLIIPESNKMIQRRNLKGDKVFDSETEKKIQKSKHRNLMDAAQDGAVSMLGLVGTLFAVAFVFLSYISWFNHTLEWFGDRVGVSELSIEKIFSYLLFPVSLAMGIEWDDCRRVAMLLGYRIASFNIISFMKLFEMKGNKAYYMQYMMTTNFTGPIREYNDDITLTLWNTTLKNGFLSDRSETIATYSLCGFSSFIHGSMTLGIMCSLLPRRRAWLTRAFGAALIAGNIANCMTGCFASLFY